MSKALIILRQYRYSVRPMKKRGSLDLYNKIGEAIEELEDPKLCNTCKFFTPCKDYFNYCDKHSHLNGFVEDTFGCIDYQKRINIPVMQPPECTS